MIEHIDYSECREGHFECHYQTRPVWFPSRRRGATGGTCQPVARVPFGEERTHTVRRRRSLGISERSVSRHEAGTVAPDQATRARYVRLYGQPWHVLWPDERPDDPGTTALTIGAAHPITAQMSGTTESPALLESGLDRRTFLHLGGLGLTSPIGPFLARILGPCCPR